MPQGNGTGPSGQGSMTGRAMGFCAGFNTPGFMNPRFGRGFGRGRGFAWRARAFQTMPIQQIQPITEQEEKELLKQELKAIEQEKQELEKRLKKIKN